MIFAIDKPAVKAYGLVGIIILCAAKTCYPNHFDTEHTFFTGKKLPFGTVHNFAHFGQPFFQKMFGNFKIHARFWLAVRLI